MDGSTSVGGLHWFGCFLPCFGIQSWQKSQPKGDGIDLSINHGIHSSKQLRNIYPVIIDAFEEFRSELSDFKSIIPNLCRFSRYQLSSLHFLSPELNTTTIDLPCLSKSKPLYACLVSSNHFDYNVGQRATNCVHGCTFWTMS